MSNIDRPIVIFLSTPHMIRPYTEADLLALGTWSVRIWVQMFPQVADFAQMPLVERRVAIAAWSKATYERVIGAVPMTIIKSRRRQDYRSFTGDLAAADVPRLLREPGISNAQLQSIEGVAPSVVKATRERSQKSWYAVQARFAIQVEDETAGLQSYEDRIVVVKAWDFDDAIKRLEPKFAHYAEPYFNSDWQLVRWQFESILDVYDIYEKQLDAQGTEVYSQIKKRRMRPEYEWHPRQASAVAESADPPSPHRSIV